MGFRYIHAAGIHLDSPLRGLSSYESAPVEQLRGATREALTQLGTTAIEDQVASVSLPETWATAHGGAPWNLSTETQVVFLIHQEHLLPAVESLFPQENVLRLQASGVGLAEVKNV